MHLPCLGCRSWRSSHRAHFGALTAISHEQCAGSYRVAVLMPQQHRRVILSHTEPAGLVCTVPSMGLTWTLPSTLPSTSISAPLITSPHHLQGHEALSPFPSPSYCSPGECHLATSSHLPSLLWVWQTIPLFNLLLWHKPYALLFLPYLWFSKVYFQSKTN